MTPGEADELLKRSVLAAERQADGLVDLAVFASARNRLHAESIELQRDGLERATAADAKHQELGLKLAGAFEGGAEGGAEVDPRVQGGVETAPEAPQPQLFAVLRDPTTAPAGWVNQVKKTYDHEMVAVDEARRLAEKHGGRFLVLSVVMYAESRSQIRLGVPDPAEGLDGLGELPF